MSWVLIAGAVVIVIVVLGVRAMLAFRTHARREFIAYLKAEDAELRITEHPDRLEIARGSGEPGTLFLQNFYLMMANVKLNDDAAKRAVFVQFAGTVCEATTIRAIDPGMDQARVFPRLVPPELLQEAEANGLRIPHRAFLDTGLLITYVLDSEHSMAHITEQTLAELGLTAETVHPLALANLRKRFKPEIVRGVFERNAMSVVKTGDGYDASRLLLVPELLSAGEVIAAAIPDRDTLVLAPAPRNGDWGSYKKLARTPAGPPLLRELLSVSQDRITVVH